MRKAFSLLEVILAIVVIGIAVSAVPFVINSGSQGISSLVSQEAVASTRSKLADILEYQWNSAMIGRNISNGAILRTSKTTDAPSAQKYTNRLILLDSNATTWVAANGIAAYDANTSVSLNQFNNYTSTTTINDDAIVQKGLISLSSRLAVNYVDPVVRSATNARIKHVEFNLTPSPNVTDALLLDFNTTFNNQNVVLRAYSFNIGIPE